MSARVSRALRWSRFPVGSSARTSRASRHGPGDRDALLLPGGKLARVVVEPVGQPDPVEKGEGPVAVGPGSERHPEEDVLEAGVALEQVERLENVADGRAAEAVAAASFRDAMSSPRSGRCPNRGPGCPR